MLVARVFIGAAEKISALHSCEKKKFFIGQKYLLFIYIYIFLPQYGFNYSCSGVVMVVVWSLLFSLSCFIEPGLFEVFFEIFSLTNPGSIIQLKYPFP